MDACCAVGEWRRLIVGSVWLLLPRVCEVSGGKRCETGCRRAAGSRGLFH